VLYELLTGRPPYAFSSLAELAAQQADGAITPVRDVEPTVPQDVEAAVMHALARDPSFRPASAAELAQELAGTAAEPATVPLRRPRRRRALPWLAGAALLVVVTVAIVLATSGGGSGSRPVAPVRVEPPAQAPSAEQQARNLARWLRAHSR
jgi:eukaryotic-like serine/threonine-protein kinase